MNDTAFLYCRFSPRPLKDGEAEQIAAHEDAQSIKVQLDASHAYCERMRLNVTSILKDAFTSARQTPLFQREQGRHLKNLPRGTNIVCLDLDRMFRDVVDGFQSLEHFKRCGVILHCANGFQADASTPDGYMMVGQKLLWSAIEPMKTAERTSRSMKHRQSHGERMTRKDCVPFGKRWDEELGRTVDDEDELEAMRMAIQLRAEGWTQEEIGQQIADLVRGGNWNPTRQNVANLLKAADALLGA